MQTLHTLLSENYQKQQTTLFDIFSKYLHGNNLEHMPFRLYTPPKNIKSKAKKGNTRGPYRKYTTTQKEQIIERMLNGQGLKKIAQETLIPKRNLIRWKHQYIHKNTKKHQNQCSDIEESLEIYRTQSNIKTQILETKENLSLQLIQYPKLQIAPIQ